jgi:hypothetical protein
MVLLALLCTAAVILGIAYCVGAMLLVTLWSKTWHWVLGGSMLLVLVFGLLFGMFLALLSSP